MSGHWHDDEYDPWCDCWPSVDEEEAELERAQARTATSLRPVDSGGRRRATASEGDAR